MREPPSLAAAAAIVAAAPLPAIETFMRPHSVTFPVRGVERLGRDMRREVGDAGAKLSAGAQAGRASLERGLEGVDPTLLSSPESLVKFPAHTCQELKTFIALVNLHL